MEFRYDAIFGLYFIGSESNQKMNDAIIEYSKFLGVEIPPEGMLNYTKIISNY